jgi:hypothetical protein
MPLVIPTYGRAKRQKTFYNLPPHLRRICYVAIQKREEHLYGDEFPCKVILPEHIQDIASTRDYLVHEVWPRDKLIMMDDDLEFAVRRTDEPTKFNDSYPEDVEQMLNALYVTLDGVAHTSVSPREGANRDTDTFCFNTRMMRVLGYNTKVLVDEHILFKPYTFMCDFGVTLELLTRGYDGIVLNSWVNNQAGSDTTGGCSTQRTPELQAGAAYYLKERFPQFVTVVEKETKTSWGGGVRTDVRVQWKQARASAGKDSKPPLLDV